MIPAKSDSDSGENDSAKNDSESARLRITFATPLFYLTTEHIRCALPLPHHGGVNVDPPPYKICPYKICNPPQDKICRDKQDFGVQNLYFCNFCSYKSYKTTEQILYFCSRFAPRGGSDKICRYKMDKSYKICSYRIGNSTKSMLSPKTKKVNEICPFCPSVHL